MDMEGRLPVGRCVNGDPGRGWLTVVVIVILLSVFDWG